MNAYEKLEKLSDTEFKLITGITRKVFAEMLEILEREKSKSEIKGGPKGVPVELRLTIALEYWREYRSMRHMANDHQIPKSTICRIILWVEDILSESEEFKLMDLKERFKPDADENEISVILVDVEEQPIERPTYDQKRSYSGKKTHTTKYQIIANYKNLEILNVYNDLGTTHDFRMFKESLIGILPTDIIAMLDSGYQGVHEFLPNSIIPFKATKKHELTEDEKEHNTMLSKQRVAIEHINRELKIFRICKETYRNKGKRGLLRVKLISAIYNHKL